MPPPRVYRAEAVVLKAFDYGEADRILTVFGAQQGKFSALAKGVRRTKSRMSGHLDLFTRSTMLVATGRQLDIVTQAETIESFSALRGDLQRVSSAHYAAELVDNFLAERLTSYPVYALTVGTLRRLSAMEDLGLVLRAFEMQLLALTGYRPQLHRCLSCGELVQQQVNYFSPQLGGVLCGQCGSADRAAPEISVSALKVLRNLQTNEEGMLRVGGLSAELHRELESRLQEYIIYRLERRPRSIRVLERLRAEAARP
jgi:DNA repair protein RecO (recombination protein O)